MRKTVHAAATATALMLTIAACGGGGSDSGAATDLTGEGTGKNCTIEAPVPVGAVLSLTGGAASYGATQEKGLKLAAEHLNAKDGVSYELTTEDDGTEPKQGITAFEKLINDGTSIIVGPTLSNTAKQTDPIAQEEGVPVLGVSNTAAGITEIGEYIYRDSLTEEQVIPQTIAAAKDELGVEKVVVMYSNDDAFTESGYQAFKAALDEQGVKVADTITFSKSDTDFRALLTEAKKADADALVVSALVEAAVPLVTQARELGIDIPIIGGNGFNTPKLIEAAGDAAEGVVVGAAWNSASKSPENAAFQKAYKEKYDSAPDQFAAQAYTGLILIDQAVREGCSAERDDLKKSLAGLNDVATPLGEFSFTDSRDAEHPAVVQIVKDGSFAVLK